MQTRPRLVVVTAREPGLGIEKLRINTTRREAVPAIDFRDDLTSLLRAMMRNGVLRESDRENLARLLGDNEKQLVGILQRIVLERLDQLGLADEFQEALKKGTADTTSYLKRTTPNPRLFLINALDEAMQEISAAFSVPVKPPKLIHRPTRKSTRR
jgi:hypothetical protein